MIFENEVAIKKYIHEREKHDIAMDKLSEKEYEDPFKDSRQQKHIVSEHCPLDGRLWFLI